MAQLDQIKSKFGFDFVQHRVSGGMAAGVPACRKRDHAKQQRRSAALAFRR
jgi:hypothetical protein